MVEWKSNICNNLSEIDTYLPRHDWLCNIWVINYVDQKLFQHTCIDFIILQYSFYYTYVYYTWGFVLVWSSGSKTGSIKGILINFIQHILVVKVTVNLYRLAVLCFLQELSKITMPIAFNEPLSFLQRITEYMEHTYLINRACSLSDSIERMQVRHTLRSSKWLQHDHHCMNSKETNI